MALIHAIRNCRKPIGRGYGRKAYYSKMYDVVIKRSIDKNNTYQNEQEAIMCDKLNDNEKEIIPIISHMRLKDNELVILWKKVEPLKDRIERTKKYEILNKLNYWWRHQDYEKHLKIIIELFQLDDNVKTICDLVAKYNLDDVKLENLGIMNNHLVILDCGWPKQC